MLQAHEHACDVPDLVYRFFNPPLQQRTGELLYGAIRCTQCPRRSHLVQKPGWKGPYWQMTPAGPMPGAVGPAVYLAGLRPYEAPQDELDAAQQAREQRRIIRAEADLAERKRLDDWREWEFLRRHIHPKQFRVVVTSVKSVKPRKFAASIKPRG